MRARLPVTLALLTAAGAALTVFGGAGGSQILQEGFEGRDPLWVKGAADAVFREAVHEITDDGPHRGQRCEHLQLTAEQGSHIHYSFPVGRAPVGDGLNASVWVKANRPGVQLLARVVLPREPNPARLEEPLTVLIRGETYLKGGRWQPLDLAGPVKLLREQQQLLRYELKHDVNVADAYIDRLVLNVYGGPGLTEVWIDDLEVAPVLDATAARPASRERDPARNGVAPSPAAARGPGLVELRGDNLMVRGERFFFRAIRHTDTPLEALRLAGFNTIWFDASTPPDAVEKAAKLGFLMVPSVPLPAGDAQPSEELARTVARFADQDDVLFWDLGSGGLAKEQADGVGRLASLVRSRDSRRPFAADVWDGFERYTRDVRLVGVHRWPLMTTLELLQYRDWLDQRRLLAQPDPFLWTWVQTHLPDWYTSLVYDRPGLGAGFDEPVGPQPEQIRLLTYLAVGSGCRGLGFWSDRFLADSHHGRDRLLTMALLNQELRLLEPLLVTASAPRWIDTSHPSIKAAVMRCDRGWLVLPMWLGPGSQFVPGQAAANNVSMVVPVPRGSEAWEVTPADVRRVDQVERVEGGWRITLPEFGLTGAVVFTNSYDGLLVYFQNEARKMRQLAAQYSYQAAESELKVVQTVHEKLEEQGHRLADGQALLTRALASLDRARSLFDTEKNYAESYHEAQRALRPLRILMRAHWEEATRDADLSSGVASPYGVSFYTLPRHWRFVEQVRRGTPGANVLPHGDFELPPGEAPPAWLSQTITVDDVTLSAERVAEDPKEGKQCLKLEIAPKHKEKPPLALERTYLAIHSPAVRLAPGTTVRVTAWVKVPKPLGASADGALFYDSAAGEPLAVRIMGPTKWRKVTLYRKVPASGTLSVTMALTGLGTAYFDDVRVEPLEDGPAEARARGP